MRRVREVRPVNLLDRALPGSDSPPRRAASPPTVETGGASSTGVARFPDLADVGALVLVTWVTAWGLVGALGALAVDHMWERLRGPQ